MDQLPRGQSSRRIRMPGVPLAPILLLPLLLAGCGGGTAESPVAVMQNASASLFRTVAGVSASTETALTPVKAQASSAERPDLDGPAAIDHDNTTRWGSRFTDDESLTLDYGVTQTITRVRIDWEAAHASAYLLQASEDGGSWTTIKSVTDSVGGTEDFTGLNGQGRYLRMKGVKRAGQYGYSILELQAFA
ncbi:MAG: discoidin domain-containing protein, partial [Massilia sp.]